MNPARLPVKCCLICLLSLLALGPLACGEIDITMKPSLATQLAFSAQPSNAVAGAAINPAVEVTARDASGNTATGFTGTVTLAFGTNAGGGTLSGTTTLNAVNGIASFSGLSVDKSANGYTLVASTVTTASATSSLFVISPAPAAELFFATQPPPSAQGNVLISPAVRVGLLDRFNNVVATGQVTLGLGTAPWPGATLSGTRTANVTNDIASFADLRIDKPGTGYRLVANVGTVTVASAPFNIVLRFSSVEAGAYHTCGLSSGGSYCWGTNGLGELGAPTAGSLDSVPVLARGGLTFTSVSAGLQHTCGVATGNTAYCWGKNTSGQLGNGTTLFSSAPVPVSSSLSFVSVKAGADRTCGVTTGNAVYCWGTNTFGQLGNGTTSNSTTPVLVSGSGTAILFASVSSGPGQDSDHTCGVTTNNAAYCWGKNASGQLGNGTTTSSTTPVLASGAVLRFSSVSAGLNHTCGVTLSNEAYCWGNGVSGQLGSGTAVSSTTPGLVSGSGTTLLFASVSAGSHTCGVTTTALGVCWGSGGAGQLGNGTTTGSPRPVGIAGSGGTGLSFASISAGQAHTCGVTTDKVVYCWGFNPTGQLGDGTLVIQRLIPTRAVQ